MFGLVVATALVVSACQVDGSAQPDAAAMSSVMAATSSSSTAGSTTSSRTSTATSASSSPSSSSSSTTSTSSSATIEDRSTSELPSTPDSSSSSSATSPSGPTLVLANDGYGVSIMVSTLWARALVAKGNKVGIRTIEDTAAQLAALKSGQVDLVAQYNSGLLGYLDHSADELTRADVDAAITDHLPTGLEVLGSTVARDDVQLVVSAATAGKYRLHSISDLSDHLADLTLLLPDDSSAKSFSTGLSNYYGLTFPTTKVTDFAGAKTIAGIKAGSAVGLMAASQYQIPDNKFVPLTDPEHLFLTENFIPVIGGKKITPAMRVVLNAVSAKLTQTDLWNLRRQVALRQGGYTDVADTWLKSKGLT